MVRVMAPEMVRVVARGGGGGRWSRGAPWRPEQRRRRAPEQGRRRAEMVRAGNLKDSMSVRHTESWRGEGGHSGVPPKAQTLPRS